MILHMLTYLAGAVGTGVFTFAINAYNIGNEKIEGPDATGWKIIFLGMTGVKATVYGILWPCSLPYQLLGFVSNLYNGDRILEGYIPMGNMHGFGLFGGVSIKDYYNKRN